MPSFSSCSLTHRNFRDPVDVGRGHPAPCTAAIGTEVSITGVVRHDEQKFGFLGAWAEDSVASVTTDTAAHSPTRIQANLTDCIFMSLYQAVKEIGKRRNVQR